MSAEEAFSEYESRISTLVDDNTALTEDNKNLSIAVGELDKQNKELTQNLLKSEEKVKNLEYDFEALKKEYKSVLKELDDLKTDLEEERSKSKANDGYRY